MSVNFSKIQNEFEKITNFSLPERQTNFLAEQKERKDMLFEDLSRLYFDNPEKAEELKKKVSEWVSDCADIETINSLAGYVFYLFEDFSQAKIFFWRTLCLNPCNYDNWRDLIFALRHLGEEDLFYGIVFNFDYAIFYFKKLNLGEKDFNLFKNLIWEIQKKSDEQSN